MSKFTVYSDKQNEFRWKFAANDNTVIARSSQGYKAREDCVSALGLLQKDITGATVHDEVRGPATPGTISPAPATPSFAPSPSPAISPAITPSFSPAVSPSVSPSPAGAASPAAPGIVLKN